MSAEKTNKLKGREAEFALNLVDNISSHPLVEDIECEIVLDKCDRLLNQSPEELVEIIKKQHEIISDCYKVSHSFNRYNSCYSAHDVWRADSIKRYEDMVEKEEEQDLFNFNEDEEVDVDISNYDIISIAEPKNTTREFGDISVDKSTMMDFFLCHPNKGRLAGKELVLIRSIHDKDKFFIVKDEIHYNVGKTTKIDERDLAAHAAKNSLLE